MVNIKEAIVVEGRYDKNTLSQLVNAPIFQTNGFGIMKDKALLSLLRLAAEKQGLIVFTDSDGAGFVIRNYIKGAIPESQLKHAYIPDVFGKEKRKACPGREGKLGVEGMTPQIILESLRRAGATFDDVSNSAPTGITKVDFAELGLSGGKESGARRRELLKHFGFPEHMSANAMLQALNMLYTRTELEEIVYKMFGENHG